MLLNVGFRREAYRYTHNEVIGTMQDGYQTITNTQKISCPQCGKVNKHDAEFCSKCGSSLVKFCSNCEAANELDAGFCDKCGKRL